MAKISARGATKIESLKSTFHFKGNDSPTTVTHTLCSDGRVLRKHENLGYRVVAKVSRASADPVRAFRAYVARYEAARS